MAAVPVHETVADDGADRRRVARASPAAPRSTGRRPTGRRRADTAVAPRSRIAVRVRPTMPAEHAGASGVDGRDHPGSGVGQQHRGAVRHQDGEGDVRLVVTSASHGGGRPAPRAVDDVDVRAVALVHEEQPLAGQAQRLGDPPAVGLDVGRVVADVPAEVEAGEGAGADTALGAGETPVEGSPGTGPDLLMPSPHGSHANGRPQEHVRGGQPDRLAAPEAGRTGYFRKSGTSRSSLSSKVTVRGGGRPAPAAGPARAPEPAAARPAAAAAPGGWAPAGPGHGGPAAGWL